MYNKLTEAQKVEQEETDLRFYEVFTKNFDKKVLNFWFNCNKILDNKLFLL